MTDDRFDSCQSERRPTLSVREIWLVILLLGFFFHYVAGNHEIFVSKFNKKTEHLRKKRNKVKNKKKKNVLK